MEIVPIVQLSLGIFTGLLVLVLLISYISFKLNKRNQNKPADEITNPVNPKNLQYVNNEKAIAQKQESYPEVAPLHYVPRDYTPVCDSDKGDQEKKEYRKTKKFTVLNDIPNTVPGFVPETTDSFSHKFAASKNKDAFAMFK